MHREICAVRRFNSAEVLIAMDWKRDASIKKSAAQRLAETGSILDSTTASDEKKVQTDNTPKQQPVQKTASSFAAATSQVLSAQASRLKPFRPQRESAEAKESNRIAATTEVMTREQFRKSIFTLVDVWTNSIEAEQCVDGVVARC